MPQHLFLCSLPEYEMLRFIPDIFVNPSHPVKKLKSLAEVF